MQFLLFFLSNIYFFSDTWLPPSDSSIAKVQKAACAVKVLNKMRWLMGFLFTIYAFSASVQGSVYGGRYSEVIVNEAQIYVFPGYVIFVTMFLNGWNCTSTVLLI